MSVSSLADEFQINLEDFVPIGQPSAKNELYGETVTRPIHTFELDYLKNNFLVGFGCTGFPVEFKQLQTSSRPAGEFSSNKENFYLALGYQARNGPNAALVGLNLGNESFNFKSKLPGSQDFSVNYLKVELLAKYFYYITLPKYFSISPYFGMSLIKKDFSDFKYQGVQYNPSEVLNPSFNIHFLLGIGFAFQF